MPFLSRVLAALRQKPEEYRKAVAFFSALTVTGIIFAVWSVGTSRTFTGTIAGETGTTQSASAYSVEVDNLSPLTVFGKSFRALVGGVGERFEAITEEARSLEGRGVEYQRSE